MPDTRSALLAVGTYTGPTWWTWYVGPEGVTTIVKSLQIHNGGGTSGNVDLWGGAAGQGVLLVRINVVAFAQVNQEVWLIVPPAGVLYSNIGAIGPINYWVSGTHLFGVSPIPPQEGSSYEFEES